MDMAEMAKRIAELHQVVTQQQSEIQSMRQQGQQQAPRREAPPDTRLGQPPVFVGDEAAFDNWAFKLKAYIGNQSSETLDLMRNAETFQEPLDNSDPTRGYEPTTKNRSLMQLSADGNSAQVMDDVASAKAEQERSMPKPAPMAERPSSSTSNPPRARARRIEPNVFVPHIANRPFQLYGGGLRPNSGIMFVMMGGKSGSEYHSLATSMIDEPDARGIACGLIDDETFHMAQPAAFCDLCKQRGLTQPCRECPASIESSSLFQTIREAHDEIRNSERCVRDKIEFPRGRGVVLISGRNIVNEDALIRVADVRIWLDEEDKQCIRQMLMDRGQWTLSLHASDEVEEYYVKRQATLNGGELLLKAEHMRFGEAHRKLGASIQIKCGDKSKTSHYGS